MKEDNTTPIDERDKELLMAMIHGELGAHEMEVLTERMEIESALKSKYNELLEIHSLMTDAHDDSGEIWEMDAERKSSLLDKLSVAHENDRVAAIKSNIQWRSFAGVAACFIGTIGVMHLLMPTIFRDVLGRGQIRHTESVSEESKSIDSVFLEKPVEGVETNKDVTIKDAGVYTGKNGREGKTEQTLPSSASADEFKTLQNGNKPRVYKPKPIELPASTPKVSGSSGEFGAKLLESSIVSENKKVRDEFETVQIIPIKEDYVVNQSSIEDWVIPIDGDEGTGDSMSLVPMTPTSPVELSALAKSEISRGRAQIPHEKLLDASDFSQNNESQKPAKLYKKPLSILPPGQAVFGSREATIDELSRANLALSEKKIRQGDRVAAESLVNEVLRMDPDNQLAKKQAESLDDEIRTTPAASLNYAKVNDVRRDLYELEGYYNLGKFDEALEKGEEILKKDKYNQAARRWMTKVGHERADYYASAYDETRSRFLLETDKSWEISPANGVDVDKEKSKESLNTKVETADTRYQAISELLKSAQQEAKDGDLEVAVMRYSNAKIALYGILNEYPDYASAKDIMNDIVQCENSVKILNNRKAAVRIAAGREQEILSKKISEMQNAHLREASSYIQSEEYEKAQVALKVAHQIKKDNPSVIRMMEVVREKLAVQDKLKTRVQSQTILDELSASEQTHSTFSLHVSDVSFKLARQAMIEQGVTPEITKIRPEEFVNAFDYADPSVSTREKVSCVLEQAAHPFMQQRNLMRVSMATAAVGRNNPLHLTILLDNSGSMDRDDRAASVIKAMEVLAGELKPNDKVNLISFAQNARLMAQELSGAEAKKLVELVKQAPSEGGTNIEEALRLAQKMSLKMHDEKAMSRIVLITDGAANLGDADPESLHKSIVELRQKGIAFDACAVGADKLDDTLLEALARKGDGRYYLIDKPEDAQDGFAKQLAGALNPAASNVKVQVVFNPQRVGKYKLLGFENHRLKKEDFRDDKVDAAELASQESGTAMYQFQPLADGEGDIGKVFIRYKDMGTGEMVERSWTIPYDQSAPAMEHAKPSIQLATTAVLLAEKLRGTDAGLVDFNDYQTVLNSIRANFSHDQKVKDLIKMCELSNK